jgi:hypothetical protein
VTQRNANREEAVRNLLLFAARLEEKIIEGEANVTYLVKEGTKLSLEVNEATKSKETQPRAEETHEDFQEETENFWQRFGNLFREGNLSRQR